MGIKAYRDIEALAAEYVQWPSKRDEIKKELRLQHPRYDYWYMQRIEDIAIGYDLGYEAATQQANRRVLSNAN